LEGQTPDNLRALSIAVDLSTATIFVRAHFFAVPSEQDVEDISVVETEIDADFYPTLTAETDVEIVPLGVAPRFLGGGVAYLRP
jgi:hypothetical protein